jgi:hypothetical protein
MSGVHIFLCIQGKASSKQDSALLTQVELCMIERYFVVILVLHTTSHFRGLEIGCSKECVHK